MNAPARFATPRRLHPASIVLGLPARQVIQVVVFPVLVVFASSSPSVFGGLQLFLLYAGVGLTIRAVGHQRRLYAFDGETVRISWGVLARQQRTIAVERIQQIELRRSAVGRMLGLTTVRIETAASASEPEVELRVVTHDDAVAFRDAVRAGAPIDDDTSAHSEPLLTVPSRHLVLAAFTGNRLLALPGVVLALFQFVGAQLGSFVEDMVTWVANPPQALSQFDSLLSAVALPLVIASAVIASVLTAVLVTFVRDGNFRIQRRGDELRITRGILATRDSLINVRRIQLVEVKQNWLRRAFNVVTVRLQSAGGDADARVLIPLLKRQDATALIDTILMEQTGMTLTAHPPAARYRAVLRWLRFSTPIVAVLLFAEPIAAVFSAVEPLAVSATLRTAAAGCVVAAAVSLGLASYRLRGHAVSETLLLSQSGALNRRLLITPVRKVQTTGVRANLFQRRLKLATLLVRVAGTRSVVVVHDGAVASMNRHAKQLANATDRRVSLPQSG